MCNLLEHLRDRAASWMVFLLLSFTLVSIGCDDEEEPDTQDLPSEDLLDEDNATSDSGQDIQQDEGDALDAEDLPDASEEVDLVDADLETLDQDQTDEDQIDQIDQIDPLDQTDSEEDQTTLLALGDPCVEGAECVSGRCEDLVGEQICVQPCDENCPGEGQACFQGQCIPDTYCHQDQGPGCPVDDCSLCDPNATCVESGDDRACVCNPGWSGDGEHCDDINECGAENPCGPGACTNQDGGYACDCEDGYEISGTDQPTCMDVLECDLDSARCGDGTCVEQEGSYWCDCDPGFESYGAMAPACVDILECTLDANRCGPGSCVETAGGYDCDCDPGFESNGAASPACVDILECTLDPDRCGNGLCIELVGSYACDCDRDHHPEGDPPVCVLGGICGDGEVAFDEGCDDGNLDGGDGCVNCSIQGGYLCAGEPSICALDEGDSCDDPLVLLAGDYAYDTRPMNDDISQYQGSCNVDAGGPDMVFETMVEAGSTLTLSFEPQGWEGALLVSNCDAPAALCEAYSPATSGSTTTYSMTNGEYIQDLSFVVDGQAGQSGPYQLRVSDSVEEAWLNAHNTVRANATPTPTPALEPQTWKADIAPATQYHVQQLAMSCILEHDPNRDCGVGQQAGENLFFYFSSVATSYEDVAQMAVQAWADEASDYDYTSNSCAPGQVCGHYTQVVWRNSTEIACAIAKCSDGMSYIAGCRYCSAGNFVGHPPY